METELIKGENKLLISFGGIANKPGMPVSEFNNTLRGVSINKIFLVDKDQLWYNSENNLLENLIDLINKYGSKYVMFYGNSMGGYAALKLGCVLAVNRVVAFSPQTFISKELRNKYNDNRWSDKIDYITRKFENEPFFDIKELMKYLSFHSNKSVFDIYYCKNERLDRIHAERMNDYCNLYDYSDCDHGLVKRLRDNGSLKSILLKDLM